MSQSPPSSLASTPTAASAALAQGAPIDASLKVPVLVLLAFALLHLLCASALGLIAAIQLHTPNFFGGCEYCTFGRVYPAALNLLAYGWGVNTGLAVALWLTARLARGTVPQGGLLVVAVLFWNVGVKLGVLGILAGDSTGYPWLELPRYVAPFLLVAYTLIAAWVAAVLRRGSSRELYASQWYVLASLFWFPWLYSAAQLMLVFAPVRGTVQAVVAAWFAHGFLGLWFASLGLAMVYYFLPKVLGRPIRGYYLASFAFWLFALFTAWAGPARLAGAPVPAWTQTAGRAASFMLLVPLAVLVVNFFGTLAGRWDALRHSIVLRFTAVAAVVFTLWVLRGVVGALPGMTELTGLTWFPTASDYAVVYGVFSMAAFGAIYYLAPRLLRRAWPSAVLIKAHFWFATLGLVLGIASLSLGGVFVQGRGLADPNVHLADINTGLLTWLHAATFAGILLTLGHLALTLNFFKLVLCPRHRAASAAAPVPAVLLRPAPELQAPAR
jgi:cytochrome c oxidase cbb3-type subunit 1